jgi:ABC-2 type transport system permease protein
VNGTTDTTGTVFDIGYQRYTGAREGRNRALLAVYKDGIRAALGLGRGGRALILPWFFIGVLSIIALIMAIIAGAAERLMGPGAAQQGNLPLHHDYYAIASMIIFVFAAVVAPELLCRDRREGVINLYLVRPLTSTDYLAARFAAFLTVMSVTLWIPQCILYLGLSGGDPTPLTYVKNHWIDVPRFLVAGFVMAGYVTTIAMLTASFTTRRAFAAVFLVGLFAITAPFTLGLSQELGGKVGQWLSMFSLTNIPLHVADIIFDEASELTKEAPAKQLGATVLSVWYVAWTFTGAAILWWRYRRLSA